MPRNIDPVNERTLELQLRVAGAISGLELVRRTGLQQSLVSRTLRRMGDRVVRIGGGRDTRWLLRRNLGRYGNSWPVYRIDGRGRPREFGRLSTCYAAVLFEPAAPMPAWLNAYDELPVFGGLPFFLSDLRPQGFLGRALARSLPASLELPSDVGLWQTDHVIAYMLERGDDLPGDLVLGDEMLTRALADKQRIVVPEGDRELQFPELAQRAMSGDVPGSSAGGEQPKFVVRITSEAGAHEAIVKFSPSTTTPSGRRWADLLFCEEIANRVLGTAGFEVPPARANCYGSRVFLESTRFDRIGAHGRRGLLSVEAVATGVLGCEIEWRATAAGLATHGLLAAEQSTRTAALVWFGHLIANRDMHGGNLSFVEEEGELPRLRLAPIYDMLPMDFSPRAPTGEIVPHRLTPPPPFPADLAAATTACAWGFEFWKRVAQDERISDDFQRIAQECLTTLTEWQRRFISS